MVHGLIAHAYQKQFAAYTSIISVASQHLSPVILHQGSKYKVLVPQRQDILLPFTVNSVYFNLIIDFVMEREPSLVT